MQELIDLLMRPETLVRGLSIAVLVTVATQAIRLFGPVIGGLISSMPMVSAPAYFIMIGQSSVPFVTEAVTYSLIYMGAAQIFLLLFMHCVRRMSLRACSLVAGTGWCAMILLLRLLPPNPWLGASSFIAITLITRRLARPALGLPATTMSVDRPWLALVKGLSAGTVVAISTSVAGQLGTSWSGVLGFPGRLRRPVCHGAGAFRSRHSGCDALFRNARSDQSCWILLCHGNRPWSFRSDDGVLDRDRDRSHHHGRDEPVAVGAGLFTARHISMLKRHIFSLSDVISGGLLTLYTGVRSLRRWCWPWRRTDHCRLAGGYLSCLILDATMVNLLRRKSHVPGIDEPEVF